MKERPILFSAPMVRAILDGQKTQTRRIVKPQPPFGCRYVINGAYSHALCQSIDRPEVWVPPTARSVDYRLPCSYGKPGDRLWVKETFSAHGAFGVAGRIIYRAEIEGIEPHGLRWTPSIFMPRAASRITLELTAVRVDRLNDISEEDAISEGLSPCQNDDEFGWAMQNGEMAVDPRVAYESLWEAINGPGLWALNPWVWVLMFRRIIP